jgi:hypothetical protein
MTHLEWLRRPPRRRSMKTLLELFAKYQWLEERIGRGLPIPISKERQQVYARCRFAFKMRLFIFHDGTHLDGCGRAFALNVLVIIKSQHRLSEH